MLRNCASLRASVVVRSGSSNGTKAAVTEGVTVKVVSEVKVFHAPKHSGGLQLKGLVGTVQKDVSEYQGKELSATLPYKVNFLLDDGVKFSAHMGEDELEVVQ